MDLHLRGKRVLITGASKGIGAAATEAFAEEGGCTSGAIFTVDCGISAGWAETSSVIASAMTAR